MDSSFTNGKKYLAESIRRVKLLAPLHILITHRYLIHQLVKKELHAKYRKSALGLMWLLINPVLLVSAYTLVFGVLLRVRWGGAGSTLEFALVLHAGVMFYMFFSEILSRSTNLVAAHKPFVTKMVFPMDVIPWVVTIVAAVTFVTTLLVWIVLYIAIKWQFPIGVIWVPLIFLPFLLFCLGLCWFVSALAAYRPDVEHGMPMLLLLLMYLSPLLFPVSKMPSEFRFIIMFNPLSHVLEPARAALLDGKMPDLRVVAVGTLFSLLVAWFGLASFRGNQKGFADVL